MAKSTSKPVTRIATPTSDIDRLRMRGKDVLSEVVGEMTFAEAFYLIVTGREADATTRKVMDASLVILMDHGLTPSALVARLVHDSVPDDIQVGMAAGMLMVANKFAGTIAGAGEYLAEGMSQAGDKRQWAADLVARSRAERRRIPGFGHPYYYPDDPRASRLFEIASAAGVKGDYVALIKLVGEEIDRAAGKHLTMNVTGALGAVLSEVAFPVAAMRAVSAVGRAAGLVAHIVEEAESPITPSVVELANAIGYEDPV